MVFQTEREGGKRREREGGKGREREKGWVGEKRGVGEDEGRKNRARGEQPHGDNHKNYSSESCEGLEIILIFYSEQPLTKVK